MSSMEEFVDEDLKLLILLQKFRDIMNIVKIVVGMHKHPFLYKEELSKIHLKIK